MFKTKSGKQPICTYNIRLYHGTNTLLEKPEVLYGSPDSDFGLRKAVLFQITGLHGQIFNPQGVVIYNGQD